MTTLEEYVNDLNESLTPTGSQVLPATVNSTAASFGKTLISGIEQKLGWTDAQTEPVQQIYMSIYFALATANGYVNVQTDSKEIPQLVSTAAALIGYLDYIILISNSLPAFIDEIKNQLEKSVNGNFSEVEFTSAITSVYEFVQMANTVAIHYDKEITLSNGALDVQPISAQLSSIFGAINNLAAMASATYNEYAQGNVYKPHMDQFLLAFESLQKVIPGTTKVFEETKEKLEKMINPMFTEEEFSKFNEYLKEFTRVCSILFFVCTIYSTYNTESISVTLEVLKIFAQFVHKITSKFTLLMRFRGKFQKTIKEIFQIYQSMGTIFKPLLESMIASSVLAPVGFKSIGEQIIVAKFTELQKLYDDFTVKVPILIDAIKQDRRFSVLANIEDIINSPIAEGAAPLIETASLLSEQLLLDDQGLDPIVQTTGKLSTCYQSFMEFFMQQINSETDGDKKIRLIKQRDIINLTMTEFVAAFNEYIAKQNNILYKLKAGVLASQFALATLSLDQHPVITKHLGSIKTVLAHSVVSCVTANLKVFLQVLSIIYSHMNDIPENTRPLFNSIFNLVMAAMQEATPKLQASVDSSDANNVITCIHEGDKISALLTALIETLVTSQAESITTASAIFKLFNFTLKKINNCFRLSLMISFNSDITNFTVLMEPYLEMANTVFSTKGDEVYNKFLAQKEKITQEIAKINELFKTLPPFGVYSQEYFSNLITESQVLLQVFLEVEKELGPAAKGATCYQQLRQVNTMFSGLTNSMLSTKQFLGAAQVESIPDLPMLDGFQIRASLQSTQPLLAQVADKLQNDPTTLTASCHQLLEHLFDIADVISKNEQYKEVTTSLKKCAIFIETTSIVYAAGEKGQYNSIIQVLQTLIQMLQQHLAPLSESLISTAPRAKTAEITGSSPEAAKAKLEETGEIVGSNGKKIDGLRVDKIPSDKEVNDLYMQVNSDPKLEKYRPQIGALIDTLKKAISKFKDIHQEYLKSPNEQLLGNLNAYADFIQDTMNATKDAIAFDENTGTMEEITNHIQKMAKSGKPSISDITKLALQLSSYVNKQEQNEDVKKVVTQHIVEAMSDASTMDPAGFAKLQTILRLQIQDPKDVVAELTEELKDAASKKDSEKANDIIPRLLCAEHILRQATDASVKLSNATAAPRQNLMDIYGKGRKLEESDFKNLTDSLEHFEEAMYSATNDEELQDDEIPDKVLDVSQDAASLIATIILDSKKGRNEGFIKNYQDLLTKSLRAVIAALSGAIRRGSLINKDDIQDLNENIVKLIDDLAKFRDEVEKANKGSINNRAIGKLQREMAIALATISASCDAFMTLEPDNTDSYNSDALKLIMNVIKLFKASNAKDKTPRKLIFKNIHPTVIVNMKDYKARAISMVQGTEEAPEIQVSINNLEKNINGMIADKLTNEQVTETFKSIVALLSKINDALNTDVVPQPEAAYKLPFRFATESAPVENPKPIQELSAAIDSQSEQAAKSLSDLIAVLNNTKSSGDLIISSLASFHASLNKLIMPVELMRYSTWNPACQGRLLSSHNSLVSVGDSAIDAARARLLGSENWRQNVAQLTESYDMAREDAKQSANASIAAVEQDLSATNEAERELISAAQSIQKSQSRLASFKTEAQEQKAATKVTGSSYFGVEIIDISAPILNSAAKLIEAAQAQTKYVLQRQPDLTNTKGLVNTAHNLVDSLELILVAAEAIVKNEADAIPKVLASCNLISTAIAHFIVECMQKDGSPEINEVINSITNQIQETIKHVRKFGEDAQEKIQEAQSSSTTKKKRALNSMIEKINAEAKVAEARKLLEEAERKVKHARLNK